MMRVTPTIALLLFACGSAPAEPIDAGLCAFPEGIAPECSIDLKVCAGDPPELGPACESEWRAAGDCKAQRYVAAAQACRMITGCDRFADYTECFGECGRVLYYCGATTKTEIECDDERRACMLACGPHIAACE